MEFKKLRLHEKGINVEEKENVIDINNNLHHVEKVEENDDGNFDLFELSGSRQNKNFEADKALHIDLILFEVQRHLSSLSDLLHFRQVGRHWHNNITSTSAIVKNCRERELKFVFRKNINGYSQVGRQDLTLEKFNNIFKNCPKLPFASFSIEKGSFTTPDAQEFLSLYGQHVTTLRWRIRPSVLSPMTCRLEDEDDDFLRRTIGSFRRLLTIDVPNLTNLIIEGTPRQWENCTYDELFPSPARLLELPNLKFIKFGDEAVCTPIIREILCAAKNLERIENGDVELLEIVMELVPTKIHTIKHFFFSHSFHELHVEVYQRYAELNPKLEKVCIHYEDTFENLDFDERNELGTAISKILRSSQHTLNKIMLCPLSFLSEFQLPILANVQKISFRDTDAIYEDEEIEEYRMMPEGQEIAKIFPNVIFISFHMEVFHGSQEGLCWDDFFDEDECLPSCKSLKIKDVTSETADWFMEIAHFLPNIENLHIVAYDLEEAASELFQGIWNNFPKVKTLKLQLRVRQFEEDFASVMDSAFTGIEKELCSSCSGKSSKLTIEEVNKLRTNSSIVDLHSLKSLVMEFDVRGLWEDNAVSPIFSIAGPYGFALIKERQNVQIKVATFYPAPLEKISKFRSSLGTVMDYVDSFEPQIEDSD